MNYGSCCAGWVGGFESRLSGLEEPSVRYHPASSVVLTYPRNPGKGHSKAGSLTGAVAPQIGKGAWQAMGRVFGNQPAGGKAVQWFAVSAPRRARKKTGLSGAGCVQWWAH